MSTESSPTVQWANPCIKAVQTMPEAMSRKKPKNGSTKCGIRLRGKYRYFADGIVRILINNVA